MSLPTFESAQWEIVGEVDPNRDFSPMSFEVVSQKEKTVDDYSIDFGGSMPDGTTRYWHSRGPQAPVAALEEKEEGTLITDEALDQIKQEAFNAGLQQGIQESTRQFEAEKLAIHQQLDTLLSDLAQQVTAEFARLEEQMLSVCMALSEKLLEGSVELNPDYLLPLLRKAIDLVGGATIRQVRVSQEDYDFIQAIGIAKGLKEYDGTWQFSPDASVRAGCIVDASFGEINAELFSALARVQEHIIQAVRTT